MKSIPKQNSNNLKNVGVNVGKSSFDIYIYELDLHWQCGNDSASIKALTAKLARYKLVKVIVEATAGYEREFVYSLAVRNLPVIVVQPTKMPQFAKAQGVLSQNR